LTNKSRLRLLHRREEHLQDLFALARAQIARLADDEARYVQFLEGVIVQGLLQLLEPSATVYARAKDAAIAARALDGAKKTYYDISGRQVELELDASLGDELAGGIKLISGSRRITLDNTLDERLRLLEDRMLPEIRYDLFGPNGNRKFYT